MWFLAFELFKPSTWLSGTAEGVMGAILSGIRTLLFNITVIVYKLIVLVYSLFDKLCSARLLSNEILGTMASRIGLILGLVMFFYVVFSLIQMLIDPGKISDKENGAGAIVKKSILVIFMLGISNFGFELLYDVQNKIIDSNVISRIILPYSIKGEDKDKFGNMLSFQLMQAFYQIDDINSANITDIDGNDKFDACTILKDSFLQQIYSDNEYYIGYMCLNESVKISTDSPGSINNGSIDEVFIIDFNGIVALAAGGFTVYILLMYCFKVGIRMIQLAFLEIISPMAIVSYLSPKKDNMLSKWKSLYLSTYIDVFIRIAIINFVIFLICTIFSENENFVFWESLGYISTGEKLFFTVVIILALLTFAKKAPDLLKELLPVGKGLGFGLGMKDIWGLEKGTKWATKTAGGLLGGALGGAAIGLLGGGLGGTLGGLLKGGLSGLKGQGFGKTAASAWKAQQASNKRIRDWRAAGGTSAFGRWGASFNQWRGMDTEADIFDREKELLEAENSAYKAFDGYMDAAEKRAESQILKGKFSGNANAIEALKQKNLAELYRQQSINKNDYALHDDEGNFTGYDEAAYEYDMEDLANKASAAEAEYLNKMKEAKKDYISATLSNSIDDAVAMQSLTQAAGVIDANRSNNYTGFSGTSGETLLHGDYDSFDRVNSNSKRIQARNNNRIATNNQAGKAARANAKYSGRK